MHASRNARKRGIGERIEGVVWNPATSHEGFKVELTYGKLYIAADVASAQRPRGTGASPYPVKDSDSLISAGGFARFYTPLAATSLLLTATNPILAAALARSVDPVTALAGYQAAFSVCGVLYAPLLVVQQVAAARLLGGGSFSPVTRFAYLTGALLSLIGALIAYTAAGDLVFARFIGVSAEVLDESVRAMQWLWPVPFLTAVRAAHQGRLVAGHRTIPIAGATGGRTAILAIVAFSLLATGGGAWLGAAAFTTGMVVEMAVVMWARSPGLELERDDCELDNENVARFSAPLMLNVLLWWATPLIITAVLARTADPDRAIAAFAVVEAVAWFIAAPVGQMQHASIALVKCSETHRRVRSWGAVVAFSMVGLLLVLSIPSLREPILRFVFALEAGLLGVAGPALPIAAAYPLLYGVRQYYQGLFVRSGKPVLVGTGALLRVLSIVAAALFLQNAVVGGAVLGVGLAVFGLTIEGIFLVYWARRGVMPGLRAERAAAVNPEAFEGVA